MIVLSAVFFARLGMQKLADCDSGKRIPWTAVHIIKNYLSAFSSWESKKSDTLIKIGNCYIWCTCFNSIKTILYFQLDRQPNLILGKSNNVYERMFGVSCAAHLNYAGIFLKPWIVRQQAKKNLVNDSSLLVIRIVKRDMDQSVQFSPL